MTSNFLFLFTISFLFLACAKQEKKHDSRNSKSHIFSKETELSFEMIERNRALEYYKKLRARKKSKPKKRKYKTHNYSRKPIIKKVRKKIVPRFHRVNVKEQEQELLQRVSYFCMEHRKEKRFIENRGGSNCSDFTDRIMANCQVKYPLGTRELTSCLKRNLY